MSAACCREQVRGEELSIDAGAGYLRQCRGGAREYLREFFPAQVVHIHLHELSLRSLNSSKPVTAYG